MRIAIAYDSLFPWSKGGGERQYRRFAEEFVAAGHDVTYLTRLQWDEPPSIEGIEVVAVSTDRELYDANGVRTLGPALRYAQGLVKHLRANRNRYDAVLVAALPTTNVLAVRAALVGTKTAVGVDWLEVWRPDQWRTYSGPLVGTVASVLQWTAAKLSPVASCHSRMNAARLKASGLRSQPLVSPGLIDPQGDIEPNLSTTTPPNVVYVGRHIPDKRVEALPAAIAHARKQIPDLTATIFGEGAARAAVEAEINRLGLRDVIRTPGFVSQEELDQGIRTAAALVNPSQREGYGLVVVEAAAVGTPVVLANAEDNASVELVENGVNGQVAASVAPAELGEAIVTVVNAGEPLRKSTHDWYMRVSRTNTIQAAARQILDRLVQAAALR
ncbi:glycosyltransferase [Kibdelosporangium philippinense]|uniref:Glycosyltransferase n=1 Tax=Kibdelosporangium philippinense TaxID=211113 RepID=A0ABS8ZM29_9PSEU|nr:glycosyltransferase [Kibdelosporangium philippinense]MCE7008858.1 glycosyltransferase [Kibdelosporangium philippinense]